MSYISDTLKLLADIPISDIARARVELAFDQLASAQRQIEDLRFQVARLELEKEQLNSALQEARRDQQIAEQKHREIQEHHAEEVRIAAGVEFHRGIRTGRKWLPFCPICRLPIVLHRSSGQRTPTCSNNQCTWWAIVSADEIDATADALGAQSE